MPVIERFRHSVPPRNNGSANIARSAIDQVQHAAVKQYENALSVNARPVLYFAKKLSGSRCSCVYGMHQEEGAPITNATGVNKAPPDGFGSEDFIQSALQGTVFSINRYGTRPNDPDFTPPTQSGTAPASQQQTTRLDDLNRPNIVSEDTEDFVSAPVGDNLFNEAPKACGVCMNTGFVGGYDPYNMLRHVYDFQAAWNNIVLLEDERPFSMGQIGNPVVSVLVPRGARNLLALRIWNSREQLSNIDILLNGAPFFNEWREQRGNLVTLSLRFTNKEQTFTHIELMWDIGMPPILVEWSKLEYSENLDVLDQINDVQLIVSAHVPKVSLYDIIVEDVFNRSWKITDVNTNFDREKHVGGWNASARVLQRYEIYNLLPHMKLRTYNWANQTVPFQQNVAGISPVEPFSAGKQTPYR